MRLAKVDGNQIVEYPYGLTELKRDNPNVIFTLPLNIESLIEYDVVEVLSTPLPDYDPVLYNISEVDPVFEDGAWRQEFLLQRVSVEEENERYNSRANWQQFYNGLLINAAFARARAGAAEVLAINAAYTDTANALALAAQGLVNVPAIQACFDNLMSVMSGNFELTQGQKDGLQALLEICYLDRLIVLNW